MPDRRPGRAQGQRVRGLTRERLLEAAEDAFFTNGYGATSVDTIAAGAGLTTGAIYSNFGGKADLFLAVLERVADRELVAMQNALDSTSSDEQVLAAFTASFAVDTDRWRTRVAATAEFIAMARTKPELQRRMSEAQSRVDATLGEVLVAVNRGLGLPPPADLDRLTEAISALIGGFALRALFRTSTDLVADISHGVTELLAGAAAISTDEGHAHAAR